MFCSYPKISLPFPVARHKSLILQRRASNSPGSWGVSEIAHLCPGSMCWDECFMFKHLPYVKLKEALKCRFFSTIYISKWCLCDEAVPCIAKPCGILRGHKTKQHIHSFQGWDPTVVAVGPHFSEHPTGLVVWQIQNTKPQHASMRRRYSHCKELHIKWARRSNPRLPGF